MLARLLGVLSLAGGLVFGPCVMPAVSAPKPNILFVIMDDVGIDQLKLFGYGGRGVGKLAPPRTPTLDQIAQSGVTFRNTWATPECSPSRVSMFTGRFPMRHNVQAALLPPDLAASQQSPYETTTPNILRQAGYVSALFGKAHFTNSPTNPQDPSTDPYGGTAVTQLGWDYFKGWYDGGPSDVDTTAGGVGTSGTYMCGYVPTTAVDPDHGADSGACYKPDGDCTYMSTGTGYATPGLSCLAAGEGASQLSGPLRANYLALVTSLTDTLNSQKACPGDANLDALVNSVDLSNQAEWRTITSDTSTWWDLNQDGYTNDADRLALIQLAATANCTLQPGQYR